MNHLRSLVIIMLLTSSTFVFSQNLFTHSNAASPGNESNAVTGFTNTSGVLLSATNTEAFTGSYSIKLETSLTNDRSVDYYFSAVVGEEYQIKIWAKQGAQSNDPAFAGWTGLSGFSTTVIGTATWTEYSWALTATSTNPKIRIFSGSSNGGAIGDVVYIDNISIVSTTSPTITTHYGIGSGSQGNYNTFFGTYTGVATSGSSNTLIGAESGRNTTTGNENTFLGRHSGFTNITGSGNVFIGNKAGYNETSSNKLYIDNSDTTTPLLYGDFNSNQLGINTTTVPIGYALAVKGKVIAEKIKVQVYPWADYVFEEDYKLPTLEEVAMHIKEKGHLENIPSAEEVDKEGIYVGEMQAKLLRKIEELTLYTIAQEEKLKNQQEKLEDINLLKEENKTLQERLAVIEQLLNKSAKN